MATNETATEPVTDEEITTKNRHTTGAPIDGIEATVEPADAPQKNRHTTSEPAD